MSATIETLKSLSDSDFKKFIESRKKIKNSRHDLFKLKRDQQDYPLALSQEPLWYLSQLNPTNSAYNVPLLLTIRGKFNVKKFEKSINLIIQRHEILHTIIINRQGIPRIKILPEFQLIIPIVDLSSFQEQQLLKNEIIANEANLAFEIDKQPLVRAKIILLSFEYCEVIVTFHHLIFDGWSVNVFLKELAAYYNEEQEMQSLTYQFLDFANWQRVKYEKGDFEQQINFWQQQLGQDNPLLSLNCDKNRPSVNSFQGARYSQALPNNLFNELNEIARELHTTTFVICLSSLFILLYQHTRQHDIHIGYPIANRQIPGFENLIGAFMNTLVMRINVNPTISLRDFINLIKVKAYQQQVNQDVPFDKIIERLDITSQASYNPVFQVLFAFQNINLPVYQLKECEVDIHLANINAAKFDLTFQVITQKSEIEVEIEYSTDLFSVETVKRIMEHWLYIMTQLKPMLSQKIYQVSTVSDIELKKYHLFNDTHLKFDTPFLLHELFCQQAQITPKNIAIEFQNYSMTYYDVDIFTNKLANYFIKRGIGTETYVGVYFERSTELVLTILAILKAGAAYLPISIEDPIERINFIKEDAGLTTIITSCDLCSRLQKISSISVLTFDTIKPLLEYESTILAPGDIKPTNAAYVIYTSGSTGKPKGVINEHQGIVNYINARKRQFDINYSDRFIFKTPYTFDVSVWELFIPLSMGAILVILEPDKHKDSRYLIDFIVQKKISIIHFVPSMLELFLQDKSVVLCKSLKHVYCSGEKLLINQVYAFYEKLNAQLINLYGPTEAAIDVTYWFCNKTDKTVPIGKPLPNIQIYILDEYLQLVSIGVIGEIYIGGASVARGYLNRPDITANAFVPDPFNSAFGSRLYKTGDLGRYLPSNVIEMIGREDDQIKIRGIRIELGEIVSALKQHPDINHAIAVKHIDDKNNERIVAYFTSISKLPLATEELQLYLKITLPDYMLPTFMIQLDSIPLLSNGKLNKNLLPDPLKINTIEKNDQQPQNHIEEKLLTIWRDLLGIENIGLNQNFFSLGGHSLLAIQLISRIERVFFVTLPLHSILLAPTISELSKQIINQTDTITNPQEIEQLIHTITDLGEENIFKPFPLNRVQEAYWIGKSADLELGNVSAHFYIEIDSIKKIVHNDLDRALNLLIKRHPMLRAIVQPTGEQCILDLTAHYSCTYFDFSKLPDSQAQPALLNIRSDLANKKYESHLFPLFDIVLVKLNNKNRLCFSFDLIICDAHSLYIFFQELYQLLFNPTIQLPLIEFTFRDYVLAEKHLIYTNVYQRSADYWRKRLNRLPTAPKLPMLKQPNQITKPIFKRRAFYLNTENWQALKELAGQLNITPSTILLCAFSYILALWSNKSSFTLNLTLFNRIPFHPSVSHILGDFTTLILLQIELNENTSFATRAKDIQNQLWNDLEHRWYSGIEVIRDYAQLHNCSGTALMPIVFTSTLTQDVNLNASVINSLGEVVYSISQTPQVFLDNQIYEFLGQLHFHWDVVEEVFPPGLIDDMFQCYCELLVNLASDPAIATQTRFSILPKKQQQLFALTNDTKKEYDVHLLHEKIENAFRQNPDAVAVISTEGRLTYQQLMNTAAQLCNWLNHHKVKSQIAAIIMPKCWQQIVAVLGILNAGMAYLPIDPELPEDRIAYLLTHSNIKHIITTQSSHLNSNFETDIYFIEHISKTETVCNPCTKYSDMAYIIYTSGSTGLPKGVVISHDSAVNTIEDINNRFAVSRNDKVLSVSAFNFDLSVYDIFGLLSVGGSLVLPSEDHSKDPAHWLELMHEEHITIWNSTPLLLELLVDYAVEIGNKLPESLRLILLSGDWIPINLPQKIRDLSQNDRLQIISLGGATEASIWSIYYEITKIAPSWSSIPYGKPLANQTIFILNNAFELCPIWVTGEIYIGGKGLAKGYWLDEQRTNQHFVINPHNGERLYKTGDLGRYLPDGNIEFLGRNDRQIKIRGNRVELEEIEKTLLNHNEIDSALVTVTKDKNNEQKLIAYILQKNNLYTDDFKKYLQTQLPSYMIPHSIITITDWPITANGKIDVSALQNKMVQNTIQRNATNTRGNNSKSTVQKIVTEILQQYEIDENTNLLQLGITSVDVIRIANAIEKEFNIRIKFKEFYNNPSIDGIVNYIEDITPTPSSKTNIIYDLKLRDEFKQAKHWYIQREDGHYIDLPLADNFKQPNFNCDLFQAQKDFRNDVTPLHTLSALLKPLSHSQKNKLQCFYPSFGDLYAVQLYLYAAPMGVESLNAGCYYYDSIQHKLLKISHALVPSDCYVPFVYRPVFEKASFAFFLIADLDAIEPLYEGESLKLLTLEAGYMGQLLITSAACNDLSLHPVGVLDFEKAKDCFNLKTSQVLIHSMLGGMRCITETSAEEMEQEWLYGEIE